MPKLIAALACALVLLVGGCGAQNKASDPETSLYSWPGEDWEVSTPEAEGLDPEPIARFIERIRADEFGLVDHLIVIRNGRIVADERIERDYAALREELKPGELISPNAPYDQYDYDNPDFHPYLQGTDLHTLQSVTKSVTSASLGIALAEGQIESTSVPIIGFFGDYAFDQSDPRKALITLDDLLTMRSGIQWTTEGGYAEGHSTVIMEDSDHWMEFILNQKMDEQPGSVYEYNDGASVLIGKVLREATGRRADEWTQEKLFAPIGINEFHWKITPDGEADTEGGLFLTAHDLARIGYLFLRKGEWDGERIISQEWVERSVTPIVADTSIGDPSYGYGYQWWVPEQEDGRALAYSGSGYGGQSLLVLPDHDIVAVVMGWNLRGNYRPAQTELRTNILPQALGLKPGGAEIASE